MRAWLIRWLIGATLVVLFAWLIQNATDYELDRRSPVRVEDARAAEQVELYQGKPIRWWARRAVQARKDANARGRTIRRLQSAQLRAGAHFFAWLANADCVHSYEGAWDDPNAPYWGGMQANMDFMRAYAPTYLARWGTADKWPWWAQMHMAYNGWLFRGWHPWPNTARKCGLL